MKTAQVVYYTQSGNTEKLAKALGEELSCPVGDITTAVTEKVDVLFLGASLYKFGIDKKVLAFIKTLDPNSVGTVAIFATSCGMETAYGILKKALVKQGIAVSTEQFYCRGKFLGANKTRPDENDLANVRAFGKSLMD